MAPGRAAMAVQQHWTVEYAVTPEARDDVTERELCIDRASGSRSGRRTQQAEAEYRTAMRVDAGGGCKHRCFGFEANDPEPSHAAATRGRVGKILKIWLDGRGTAAKRVSVHVVVAAAIDMAHETRLRPCFQFHEKTLERAVANRVGVTD